MKIKLDSREVSNILNDWARNQYRTKNVTSMFNLSVPGDVSVDIEVMLSDIDMDSYHSRTVQSFAERLAHQKMDADKVPDIELEVPSGLGVPI